MREWINKVLGWLLTSNRLAHLLCVGVMSIALGWCAGAIGCAIGGAIHYYIFRHL